jgi:ribosomal protein S27E
MTMRYEDDPPEPVVEMTRAEFLKVCPRAPMDLNGTLVFFESADEVICDSCGKDPGGTVVTYGEPPMRAYCLDCARKEWYPYCTPAD